MRFIFVLGIIGVCHGSVTRLRKLFDQLEPFLGEKGTVPSTEVKENIVSKAIEFSKTETRNEADMFVNILEIAGKNNIGKQELETLMWDALGYLYTETSPSDSLVAIESNSVKPMRKEIDNSLQIDSLERNKKRVLESNDPLSIKKQRSDRTKELLLVKLEFFSRKLLRLPEAHEGFLALQFKLYRLALNEDYDALMNDIQILEDSISFFIPDVFKYAHKVLLDPNYRLSELDLTRLMAARRIVEERESRPATKKMLFDRLAKMVRADRPVKDPFRSMKKMSDKLYSMLVVGDLETFRYHLNLLDAGYVGKGRFVSILKKSYEYLKNDLNQ